MSRLCPSCGAQIPEGSAACPACQKPPGQSSAAGEAVAAAKPPAGETGGLAVARLGDRLLATLLDTLLLAAIFAAVGMWAALRWGGVTANGFSLEGSPAVIVLSLLALAGLLYYWILEAAMGATLGKTIVGIQVRAKGGGKCGFGAALVRNLLRIVDGIAVYLVGLIVAVCSRLRQRLGDHVAGTVVVERKYRGLTRIAVVILWLAGIGSGFAGAYLLHRSAPLSETKAAQLGSSSAVVPAGGEAAGATSNRPLVLSSGDFKLLNFAFTEGEDGPLRKAIPYRPGDHVYAKFDLTGFTTDPQGRIDVTTSITGYDANGLALDNTWTNTTRDTLPTATTPINYHYSFNLPAYVPGGTYRMAIKAHDAVKNSDAEFAPTFAVETSPPIPPASKLEVRNFRFSTSEDGPPLSPAAYKLGETVHYSYDLFGMSFHDDRATVETAFRLIGPDGTTVLDRPDWDTTDRTVVYHPANFFVHFNGYVTLPGGVPKGTYTAQFVMSDKQADATLKYEGKFEVP